MSVTSQEGYMCGVKRRVTLIRGPVHFFYFFLLKISHHTVLRH